MKKKQKKTWELTRHGQRWTQKEEDLLQKLYPTTVAKDLAEQLDRTVGAVRAKIAHLKIRKIPPSGAPRQTPRPWSERDIKTLRKLWQQGKTGKEIAAILGKTRQSVAGQVQRQIRDFGLHKKFVWPKRWSKEEDEYLILNYHKTPRSRIVAALGRTVNAIEHRAACLNIHRKWNDRNIETLRRLWLKGKSGEEIAEKIGKTAGAVKSKANALGLKRELFWTAEETGLLKHYYPTLSNKKIAEKLDKTIPAVMHKAATLGLKKDTSWTAKEIAILKKYYQTLPDKQIVAKLRNKTANAVKVKALSLGLTKRTSRKEMSWTAVETDFLQKNYNTLTYKQIAQKLGKTRSAVLAKAWRLRLGADKLWTAEEIDILKKYYNQLSDEEVAKKLARRTPSAIWQKAHKLGLKKDRYWTAEQIAILKKYYQTLPTAQIAAKLGNKTTAAIKGKAFLLGLKKEGWFWAAEEITVLKKYYQTLPNKQIAQKLGHRSLMTVKAKARELGLKKT